jgi:hypothetical protein
MSSRLTVTAAEWLPEKQTGHASAAEVAPAQSNVKLNAMIMRSRRIGEPFDPSALAMIKAQINGSETRRPIIAAMTRAAQAAKGCGVSQSPLGRPLLDVDESPWRDRVLSGRSGRSSSLFGGR